MWTALQTRKRSQRLLIMVPQNPTRIFQNISRLSNLDTLRSRQQSWIIKVAFSCGICLKFCMLPDGRKKYFVIPLSFYLLSYRQISTLESRQSNLCFSNVMNLCQGHVPREKEVMTVNMRSHLGEKQRAELQVFRGVSKASLIPTTVPNFIQERPTFPRDGSCKDTRLVLWFLSL